VRDRSVSPVGWIVRLFFCVLLLSPAAKAYTIEEIAQADNLLRLLDQRLRISELVAQAKWRSDSPIQDLTREQQVIEAFVTRAGEAAVEPALAGAFMRAQIEASKVRQRALFDQWWRSRRSAFANPPNLAREIRPRLDALSLEMVNALQQAGSLEVALLRWRAEVLWGAAPDPARARALQGWLP
jgi:chorismate mutase